MRSLYDELLPHFFSRMFNVGCDETVDLGQGRSKAAVETQGIGRVYLDFLLQIYQEVTARGHTMQFWGDIIMEHPELVPDLPRDAIALEWGYEADHPFAEHGARFAASGIPFYLCPGTSTWNCIAGRTDNALANLLSAAENGLRHGAIGYLNTDWGDRGHWQPLPVSYLGFAAGAAYSWALEANRGLDVAAAVSRHAFCDPTGAAGRAAYDVGNVYQAAGYVPHNGSALFWILQLPPDRLRAHPHYGQLTPDAFDQAEAAIGRALAPLAQAPMARGDAGLIRREFALAGQMLRHACQRGRWALGIGERAAVAQPRARWLPTWMRSSPSIATCGWCATAPAAWQTASRGWKRCARIIVRRSGDRRTQILYDFVRVVRVVNVVCVVRVPIQTTSEHLSCNGNISPRPISRPQSPRPACAS